MRDKPSCRLASGAAFGDAHSLKPGSPLTWVRGTVRRLPLIWAVIIGLVIAACSRDKATVGKGPPQRASEREESSQARRASPANAAARPTKLPVKPVLRTRRTTSAASAVQTSRAKKLRGNLANYAPMPPSRTFVEARQNALGKQRFDRRRAALTNPGSTGSHGAPKTGPARPSVEVIVYDVSSGIKTVLKADGTIEEEPFDPAMLPRIKATKSRGKPRVSIVNEHAPLEGESGTDAGAKPPPSGLR
jgi:hypothetical protein